jgi:hypothetical protein
LVNASLDRFHPFISFAEPREPASGLGFVQLSIKVNLDVIHIGLSHLITRNPAKVIQPAAELNTLRIDDARVNTKALQELGIVCSGNRPARGRYRCSFFCDIHWFDDFLRRLLSA